jgi:hypothetical protein
MQLPVGTGRGGESNPNQDLCQFEIGACPVESPIWTKMLISGSLCIGMSFTTPAHIALFDSYSYDLRALIPLSETDIHQNSLFS